MPRPTTTPTGGLGLQRIGLAGVRRERRYRGRMRPGSPYSFNSLSKTVKVYCSWVCSPDPHSLFTPSGRRKSVTVRTGLPVAHHELALVVGAPELVGSVRSPGPARWASAGLVPPPLPALHQAVAGQNRGPALLAGGWSDGICGSAVPGSWGLPKSGHSRSNCRIRFST